MMTPCEKLGYKVGDKFEVTVNGHYIWDAGAIIELSDDDKSDQPEFKDDQGELEYVMLEHVKPAQESTPQWVPEVGEVVKHPTGEGVVMLPPDTQGIIIVMSTNDDECAGEYKRVAAIACEPVPTEEDRAVEEMMQASGVMVASLALRDIYRAIRDGKITGIALTDKQPQPAEDINFDDPANWRAGNVVKAIKSDCGLNFGQGYFFIKHDSYGSVIVEDEKGKQYRALAKFLHFHSISRP